MPPLLLRFNTWVQWLFVAGFGLVLAGVGLGRVEGWPGRQKREINRQIRVEIKINLNIPLSYTAYTPFKGSV